MVGQDPFRPHPAHRRVAGPGGSTSDPVRLRPTTAKLQALESFTGVAKHFAMRELYFAIVAGKCAFCDARAVLCDPRGEICSPHATSKARISVTGGRISTGSVPLNSPGSGERVGGHFENWLDRTRFARTPPDEGYRARERPRAIPWGYYRRRQSYKP